MPSDITPVATIPPMLLVQQLLNRQDFTTDMLKDMLAMVREVEQRDSDRAFNTAFAACQSQVTKAAKDKPNPLFSSRYASLEAMYDAVWPAVMAHGFGWTVSALAQAPEGWENGMLWFQGRLSMGITTKTVELPVPRAALSPEGPRGGRPAMTPTQAVGALVTYMRKYLLGMMMGVVTAEDVRVDNDGNSHLSADPPPPNKGNGERNPWDTWLDTQAIEAAKIPVGDRVAWDMFWTQERVVRALSKDGLKGARLERLQALQLAQARRVFPTEAEQQAEETNG